MVHPLTHYFIVSYLITLFICSENLAQVDFVDLRTTGFSLGILFTYSLIYLLPALALTRITQFFLGSSNARIIYAVAVVSTASTHLLLFADAQLFALYGFHINGFVLNLLGTPGGVESLGGSRETEITFIIIALSFYLAHAVLIWLMQHYIAPHKIGSRRPTRAIIALFIIVALGERVTYGISDIQLHGAVLDSASALPIYNRVTFRTWAKKMGFKVKSGVRMGVSDVALNYPLAPLQVDVPERPLNIIWLISESLRWDMLDPRIMPNTWHFAKQSQRLTNHYSGGNGTRQGLFSLFYGLFGSYWDKFLHEKRGPVLIDLLQQQRYQFYLYTSSRFTYPEFDQTIFAQIEKEKLHQSDGHQEPWLRDQENVGRLIKSIRQRDRTRPFMGYLFFESTHARYHFPPEAVIRRPYLESVNYATMSRSSLKKDIDQLKNRYINAAHFVDHQLKRVFDFVEQKALLENTIIIITGDHGEEFMEKGHWGHNSGFSQEQIRTPMVIWVPRKKAKIIDKTTSHLDIVPTLLPLIGVVNPSSDYSLGLDIFSEQSRSSTVVSDWLGAAYIGAGYKFSVPFSNSGLPKTNVLTTLDDKPVLDSLSFFKNHRQDVQQMILDARRFSQKRD